MTNDREDPNKLRASECGYPPRQGQNAARFLFLTSARFLSNFTKHRDFQPNSNFGYQIMEKHAAKHGISVQL